MQIHHTLQRREVKELFVEWDLSVSQMLRIRCMHYFCLWNWRKRIVLLCKLYCYRFGACLCRYHNLFEVWFYAIWSPTFLHSCFICLTFRSFLKGASCLLVIAFCLSGAMSFIKYDILESKLFRKTSTESDVSFEGVDIACLKRAAVWSLKFLFFFYNHSSGLRIGYNRLVKKYSEIIWQSHVLHLCCMNR